MQEVISISTSKRQELIDIKNDQLQLGTWQALQFCELDGPRNRKIIVQVMGD